MTARYSDYVCELALGKLKNVPLLVEAESPIYEQLVREGRIKRTIKSLPSYRGLYQHFCYHLYPVRFNTEYVGAGRLACNSVYYV
jgi:hypothetical protein